MNIRTLVIDDTLTFRTVVADALRTIQGIEVVGTAANGESALKKIEELKPDLITLDIEMPGMSGLDVLDEMRRRTYDAGVIIISSFTVQGGTYTIKALEKGAFDFITKPSLGSMEENRQAVIDALSIRVRAFIRTREIRSLLNIGGTQKKSDVNNYENKTSTPLNIIRHVTLAKSLHPELLLIGVSTGGPVALGVLLKSFPADFSLPILIVQHMPPMFTSALAENLNNKCSIEVKEAESGEILKGGVAYIAPGGKQMRLVKNSPVNSMAISITDDPPENNCKPSVDYFFRSVANTTSGNSIALILTGMGSDGTLGLRLLKRNGCFIIAQDETSCVVYGMPKAAVDAGIVDEILPLDRIAHRVIDLVRKQHCELSH